MNFHWHGWKVFQNWRLDHQEIFRNLLPVVAKQRTGTPVGFQSLAQDRALPLRDLQNLYETNPVIRKMDRRNHRTKFFRDGFSDLTQDEMEQDEAAPARSS